jgi:hypothetical protein
LVEQRTENPCVGGSIPSVTTSSPDSNRRGFLLNFFPGKEPLFFGYSVGIMNSRILLTVFALAIFTCMTYDSYAQGNLYTARGYWEETNKPNYVVIKQKAQKGDSLTDVEKNYLKDYDAYLLTYYQRMSQEDRDDYARLKPAWDAAVVAQQKANRPEEGGFEWRGRDRLANGLFGLWYGATLVVVTKAEGAAAVGLPLITSGLWMLGPAINPKKYENIDRNTIRANNTGKLLGLVYGAALGLAISGEEKGEDVSKWAMGLSTVGSITLGEIAFHQQLKKKYTAGRIELVRHYGFLGPWVGLSTLLGTGSENANLTGGVILAGGVAGILVGNAVSRQYDYTRGDADAISSLSLISTGVGFTGIATALKKAEVPRGVWFVPAATSIIGTVWGQRQVRGAYLTDKQGSTISFSTAGAALLGIGFVALTETKEPAVAIGIPVGLALITHQLLLKNYKTKNQASRLRGDLPHNKKYDVSLNVRPESYYMNHLLSPKDYSPRAFANMQSSLINIVVRF